MPIIANNVKSDTDLTPLDPVRAWLAYRLARHGTGSQLPRALGFVRQSHTTLKSNMPEIEESGYVLDPAKGGSDRGMSDAINSSDYKNKSSGKVHLTGFKNKIGSVLDTLARRSQEGMYDFVGRMGDSKKSKGVLAKALSSIYPSPRLHKMAPVSFFESLEADPDSGGAALRSNKPMRFSKTRLGALMNAVGEYGLSGVREAPGRAALGVAGVALTGTGAYYLGKPLYDKLLKRLKDVKDRMDKVSMEKWDFTPMKVYDFIVHKLSDGTIKAVHKTLPNVTRNVADKPWIAIDRWQDGHVITMPKTYYDKVFQGYK